MKKKAAWILSTATVLSLGVWMLGSSAIDANDTVARHRGGSHGSYGSSASHGSSGGRVRVRRSRGSHGSSGGRVRTRRARGSHGSFGSHG